MYLAEYRHDKANIIELAVVKETEKSVIVDEEKNKCILGYKHYLGVRLSKESNHFFPTIAASLEWILEQATRNAKEYAETLQKIEQDIVDLKAALGAAVEKNA